MTTFPQQPVRGDVGVGVVVCRRGDPRWRGRS